MEGHVRKRHRATCAKRGDARKRCNCDGPWQARYPDPKRPGTTHKIERQFRTEREAKAWLISEQASAQVGGWIDPRTADRSFGDVLTAWQESWPTKLSPTTAARYQTIVEKYLRPEFGAAAIGSITHEWVQRYIDRLSNDPKLAAGTVRGIYSVMRNAMSRAVRLGMVKANPCTKVELPKQSREEMKFLTADEVRKLAEHIDAHYRVLIYTAAYTGLRAGELLALRRDDLDLKRGVLTVRRSLREVNGHLSFGDTKTTNSHRTISLPKFLNAMLAEHLLASEHELVFASKTGKPLRYNNFYKRHFRLAVAGYTKADGTVVPGALPAHLHSLRFHDLRHTAASLAIEAGAHVKQVSVRLGHASVQITLDRYTHLFPSAEEALAEKLDAIFQAEPVAPSNVATLAR
jgi:integrase